MPIRIVAAVLAAGAASAVLFGTTLTGTVLLAYFAQLPLFIVGLSHGWPAAAAAGAIGIVGVLTIGSFGLTVAFAVMEAVPVVILCWRALRHRYGADSKVEWYSAGALATDAMLLALAVMLVQAIIFEQFTGGPEGLEGVIAQIVPMLGPMTGQQDEAVRTLLAAMLPLVPGFAAAWWFWMTIVNGAIGQWVAQRGGMAWRPSPRMADLEMPRWVSEFFAIAVIGSLFPGLAGRLGENMVVVLLGVLVLAGFAIVHALAARSASRMLLISTYLIVIVFGVPLLLLAIAGALEPWLRLRARFLSGAAPRA